MKQKRILLCFSIIPYPLRHTGQSLRYLPIIQYLSNHHTVDLIIIDDKTIDEKNVVPLYQYCEKIHVISDPHKCRAGLLERLVTYGKYLAPWSPPNSFISHHASHFTQGIVEAIKNMHYDAIVWVGSYLLPNLISALPSISAARTVVDFVDSPSLLAKRDTERRFNSNLLERIEKWKIKRWENKIIREVDATVYISEVDANTTSSKNAPGKKRHIIPNGIHAGAYSPDKKENIPSPNIGFLGNMAYPPNIESVHWLHDRVFTPLKKNQPDLSLIIIGRDPVQSVCELNRSPGVFVTGTVEDIWSYINSVDIFVFPIWSGGGLKNKILEAMYARRPVVTTEIGNEGIDAEGGRHLALCRTPEDFQREVMRLLGSPEERDRMVASAHGFVEEKFCWDRIFRTYENLILGGVQENKPGGGAERGFGPA